MRLQEGAHPVDGPGLQFRGVLPGKYRNLGIRAERSYVDGCLERVRRDVVQQDKHLGPLRSIPAPANMGYRCYLNLRKAPSCSSLPALMDSLRNIRSIM